MRRASWLGRRASRLSLCLLICDLLEVLHGPVWLHDLVLRVDASIWGCDLAQLLSEIVLQVNLPTAEGIEVADGLGLFVLLIALKCL